MVILDTQEFEPQSPSFERKIFNNATLIYTKAVTALRETRRWTEI